MGSLELCPGQSPGTLAMSKKEQALLLSGTAVLRGSIKQGIPLWMYTGTVRVQALLHVNGGVEACTEMLNPTPWTQSGGELAVHLFPAAS